MDNIFSYIDFLPWNYNYNSPFYFILFLLCPLFFYFIYSKLNDSKSQIITSILPIYLLKIQDKKALFFQKTLPFTYILVYIFLIFALANPVYKYQSFDNNQFNYKKGIDMIITMDNSLSMLARDFEPNRLESAKDLAIEFIDKRVGDRIGLVVYEGEAMMLCPTTLDYEILKSQIKQLQPGLMEGGTAIGTGLGTAVAHLDKSKSKSKIIILLTDGVNNQGEITPEFASKLAKSKGIKVYVIGVGSLGLAPSPIVTPFGIQYEMMPVEIDENTLKTIANNTGGRYFRATDNEKLREIYKEIDKMEKTFSKNNNKNHEIPINPTAFIIWALIFFIYSTIVQWFYLKKYNL